MLDLLTRCICDPLLLRSCLSVALGPDMPLPLPVGSGLPPVRDLSILGVVCMMRTTSLRVISSASLLAAVVGIGQDEASRTPSGPRGYIAGGGGRVGTRTEATSRMGTKLGQLDLHIEFEVILLGYGYEKK